MRAGYLMRYLKARAGYLMRYLISLRRGRANKGCIDTPYEATNCCLGREGYDAAIINTR